MNSDIKSIFESYKRILENDNISNNMSGKDVSTKFTTDQMSRFTPIAQDEEEKAKLNPHKQLKIKLKDFFTHIKPLIEIVQSDKCKSSDVSRLLDIMNNPAIKTDLEELKKMLQLEDQDNGNNAKLSY